MKRFVPWLSTIFTAVLLAISTGNARADVQQCFVEPSEQVICDGGAATFTVKPSSLLVGPYSYRWFFDGVEIIPFAGMSSITVATPGTYTAGLTDGDGIEFFCVGRLSIGVAPTVTIGDIEICIGDSVVLTANTTSTDILWSTGETTKSITVTPVSTTTYTVTVGSGDCTSTAKSVVTVKACVSNPGTGTPGYWKNHPEAWPINEIIIGGITYSKAAAIALMKKATKNDKTTNMFEQLVSAKLNVLIGNDPSCIGATIAAADAWMKLHPVCSKVPAESTAWTSGAGALHTTLDKYNNGLMCAPHRD